MNKKIRLITAFIFVCLIIGAAMDRKCLTEEKNAQIEVMKPIQCDSVMNQLNFYDL